MASRQTEDDICFLDSLSGKQLKPKDFRSHIFTPEYIHSRPELFLNYDWVDMGDLRRFLSRVAPKQPEPSLPPSINVKTEPAIPAIPVFTVKTEPGAINLTPNAQGSVKIRTLYDSGREVLEICSDSDSDVEVVSAQLTRSVSRSSSIRLEPGHIADDWCPPTARELVVAAASETSTHSGHCATLEELRSDAEPDDSAVESDCEDERESDSGLFQSDTMWQDDITSYARTGNFKITRKIRNVKRIEYITQPATVYPQFPESTVIVVDPHELYSVDRLITDADQDSYQSQGSGKGSYKAWVQFGPGDKKICCRRATSTCKGTFVCEHIAPELVNVLRYSLDSASRNAVLSAQADTRRSDGNTAAQRVVIFKDVVSNSKCGAVDSDGNPCTGAPMMKPKPGGQSREHGYFIACSGWRRDFKDGHRTHTIPDNVDEQLLVKAFAGQPLTTDPNQDTKPCSRLVHPSTGHKLAYCPHAHVIGGKQARGKIIRHPCSARRSIYVPVDPAIRKALIVQNNTGHSHPLPVASKRSIIATKIYEACIIARGLVGATVDSVDNAPSTSLQLEGKTPALFSPALANRRVREEIVRNMKSKKYPSGLSLTGAFEMWMNHLSKPLPERYIHAYVTMPDGGVCILTCLVSLIKLLDDPGVTSFEADTTYKRVAGEMNEWDVTAFIKPVLKSSSVARAYINRASTDFFERVFDELQAVKLMVTGRPIALRKFVPGGNLLVLNSDMDGAQIIGICKSVMKHNVPEHSKIPAGTAPQDIAPEFVKLCWRHAKEPVGDFRSLVSQEDFKRIQDFVYIESKEALSEFSSFIESLGIKKIQDWWSHKENNSWIIPCLVKSQSRLGAGVWDATPSTTNNNEARHHWLNSLTGIKKPLVEAIEGAYTADRTLADGIEMALRTGVSINQNNEVRHRMSRNGQRQSKAAQKARDSQARTADQKRLEVQIAAEVEARRQSSTRSKELTAELQRIKSAGNANSSGRVKTVPADNSCGRVKTKQPRRAAASKSKDGTHDKDSSDPGPSQDSTVGQSVSTSTLPHVPTTALNTGVSDPVSQLRESESYAQSEDTAFFNEMLLPGSLSTVSPALDFSMFEFEWGMFSNGSGGMPVEHEVHQPHEYKLDTVVADETVPNVYSGALPMLPTLTHRPPPLPMQLYSSDLNWHGSGYNAGAGLADFDNEMASLGFGGVAEVSFSAPLADPISQYLSSLPASAGSPLPLLPALPPDSSPSRSITATPPSIKTRRPNLDGLEPANILPVGLARSRAPSSRKRDAESVPDEPSKKPKSRRTK